MYNLLSFKNDRNFKNIPHSSLMVSSRLLYSRSSLPDDILTLCQSLQNHHNNKTNNDNDENNDKNNDNHNDNNDNNSNDIDNNNSNNHNNNSNNNDNNNHNNNQNNDLDLNYEKFHY